MEPNPRPAAGRLVPDVLLALFVLGMAALTLINKVPYLQDLPEWVFQSELLAATNFGSLPIHGIEVRSVPVPNSVFVLAVALLGQQIGFVLAAKVVLILILAGTALVLRAVFRHFDPESGCWKALMGFPLFAVSSSYLNGYASYQIGVLLFLVFFYLAACKGKIGWPLALLLSVGVFLSHATVFGILIVLVAWLAVRRRIGAPAVLAVVPAIALLAWYSADSLVLNRRVESEVPDTMYASAGELLQHKAYSLAKQGPYQGFLQADGTSWMESQPWFYWAGCAVNFGFALLFVACVLSAIRRARKGEHDRALDAAVAVAVAGFVLFFLLPPTLLQVVNIGERLVIPGIVLGVAAAWRARWAWTVLAFVSLVVSLPCLAFFIGADVGLGPAKAALAAQELAPEQDDAEAVPAPFTQEEVEKMYAKTSQRLFNRRPYQFVDRYDWAAAGKVGPLAFKTGVLREYADPTVQPPK